MEIPKLIEIEQSFSHDKVQNVSSELFCGLESLQINIKQGDRIAIAVGSRGIANLPEIVRSVVHWVKQQGGEPFIIPAMGSHGNGIAAEQEAILVALGICEDTVGAPIRASMEVVELPRGESPCHVYMDKLANEADGTIIINRVKIHGDFSGDIESGLMKMCVIGVGKHKQALEVHKYDISHLEELIIAAARQVIQYGNIIAGIGVVENAYHETMMLRVLRAEQFEQEEKKMLCAYKKIMPRFPIKDFDILIVDEVGKNISGAGMETKIVGRLKSGAKEPEYPKIRYIVTTDLTEESHGNACGIGLADFITRKLFNKIDIPSSNENIITCRFIEQGRIPIIADNDYQAICYAMRAIGDKAPEDMRIIRIQNTLKMNSMYVSENILPEISTLPNVKVVGKAPVAIFREREQEMIPFNEL